MSRESYKRDLRRLLKIILDDDDGGGAGGAEAYDEALRVIAALRAISFGSPGIGKNKEFPVPEYFLCPISSEIMKDPVVVASGQTYDRAFIEDRLRSGNWTCPRSDEVLSDMTLIPNVLIHRMISEWRATQKSIPPPQENQDGCPVTQIDRIRFTELLETISSSSPIEQKQAIRDLRLLTKHSRSFRAAVGEHPEAISQLVAIPYIDVFLVDAQVLEDIITTLLNLSIHETNKAVIGDHPKAIPLLISALKYGTMEAQSNAAAALFSLSALDNMKRKIGDFGAMKPLINLLKNGSPAAKKDAASALFNLCILHSNKLKAISHGAVQSAFSSIADEFLVDESLAIVALLSRSNKAIEALRDVHKGIPILLDIIKESKCSRNRENAIYILHSACVLDDKMLREVAEDEDSNGSISRIAQEGTPRASKKAYVILDIIKNTIKSTPLQH